MFAIKPHVQSDIRLSTFQKWDVIIKGLDGTDTVC